VDPYAKYPKEYREDIKLLVEFLIKIKYLIGQLQEGIQAWWNYFDADLSDRIELKEFLLMLENL